MRAYPQSGKEVRKDSQTNTSRASGNYDQLMLDKLLPILLDRLIELGGLAQMIKERARSQGKKLGRPKGIKDKRKHRKK
ncbi:MAG: hypothetical protein MUP21_07085, partial [Dehalococcoidia bacterium]|nr:hypothetical protein [Dehalococcoidia bacterium]